MRKLHSALNSLILRVRTPRITVHSLQGEGKERIVRPGSSLFFTILYSALFGFKSLYLSLNNAEMSSGTVVLERNLGTSFKSEANGSRAASSKR